ncbi:hypothetical protein NU195Hw_g4254t1 [Hortaea werneckii]
MFWIRGYRSKTVQNLVKVAPRPLRPGRTANSGAVSAKVESLLEARLEGVHQQVALLASWAETINISDLF